MITPRDRRWGARIRRLARFSPTDWLALLLASVGVIGTRAVTAVLPYRWWRTALRPETRGRRRLSMRLNPMRVGLAVDTVARFIPGASCLPRALAARAMLIVSGHPTTLTIGVARTSTGELTGHAWLRSGGIDVVGVPPEDHFQPMQAERAIKLPEMAD